MRCFKQRLAVSTVVFLWRVFRTLLQLASLKKLDHLTGDADR